MATLKDIQRRIASVKNTQTITKAMQMVSAAKLRRAQERTMKARPYAQKTRELVMELCQGMSSDDHPFLRNPEEKKVRLGVIVVTSDKGLCGSFNNNVIFRVEKDLRELERESIEGASLITVGKKAKDYFSRKGFEIHKKYAEENRTPHEMAVEIAAEAKDKFLLGEWSEVQIYYTGFISVARYNITQETLLPVPTVDAGSEGESKNYIFEPGQKEILDRLLPTFLEVQVFKALLESETSEHAARMTAMDTASNNCKELITDLTLVYNKARQAAITKDLLDIVGGAEALKK